MLRGRRGFDLIRDYALPLPTTIIAELLGVPPSDSRRFHRWSSAIVAADASAWSAVAALPNMVAFVRYIRRQIDERRNAPRDDLLSALIEAQESEDRLSADEIVAMAFLLLIAGHETTVNAIGNGVLALIDHPNEMRRLREGANLDAGIEELLRFAGPLDTSTERYAAESYQLGDARIHRGDVVYAALASANRDESHFTAPDRLDLTRSPNRHIAFGHGIHYCVGAPLARLEMRIAIRQLLNVSDELTLAVPRAALRWRRGFVLRGLTSLPIKILFRGESR